MSGALLPGQSPPALCVGDGSEVGAGACLGLLPGRTRAGEEQQREVDQVGAPGFWPPLCRLLKATAQVLLMLLLKVLAYAMVSCSTGLVLLVVPFG